MERFLKAKEFEGYQDIFQEESPYLKYLAFGKITLKAGQEYTNETNGYETALVLLKGTATIACEGQTWEKLGGRENVFSEKATAAYIPCHSKYVIKAETDLDVAVCKVKAEEKFVKSMNIPFLHRPRAFSGGPESLNELPARVAGVIHGSPAWTGGVDVFVAAWAGLLARPA